MPGTAEFSASKTATVVLPYIPPPTPAPHLADPSPSDYEAPQVYDYAGDDDAEVEGTTLLSNAIALQAVPEPMDLFWTADSTTAEPTNLMVITTMKDYDWGDYGVTTKEVTTTLATTTLAK